jgi:DNA-binding PadR family transcriptional regulator
VPVERITRSLVDVLAVLVQAHGCDEERHGWELMRETHLAGPTVYRVLDRLEETGWITGRWEETNPDPSKPRRRFYRLSEKGLAEARTILLDRSND